MNENSKKKRNTALFMLVATVINIVLMTVFMLIGYILLVRFADPDKPEAGQIWLIVIFIGSIILAWFVYSRIIKWSSSSVSRYRATETSSVCSGRRGLRGGHSRCRCAPKPARGR